MNSDSKRENARYCWDAPMVTPRGPTGAVLGSSPGFRDVAVVDYHPNSALVQPDVPTRSVYAGTVDLYSGAENNGHSRYHLPGSLPQVWVRQEIAKALEAVHRAAKQLVPDCGGICVLDGFRTATMQKAAVRGLTIQHLAAFNITDTSREIDQAIVFDCARRARLIWEHLGLEESDLLTDIRIRIKQDQKLIKELRDIAGKDKNIDSTKVTDPDLDLMIDEYIGIIFNTGMNAERYPEIAKLDPLINNGPHMTAGATDAKLIGNNGKLLASQTPFDYPIPHLSSELVLESEQGIRQLREAAKRDPWLQEHYRKQDMDPYNITDKDIALMRMYQRFQTHIIMAAGGIPYLEGENWHVDWPENPRDPRTGRLLQDRSQFLRTNGWDSGNPSFVTEKYAPGKYATKNRPHKGVKAVFGGNDAFRKARKLGIIE